MSTEKLNQTTFDVIENQGLRLPNYIIKLLLLTGYNTLHTISKLIDNDLIAEIELYASDHLEPADLGLPENEERFYFSIKTKQFKILPGHKHLITAAAFLACRVLQDNQTTIICPEIDSENEEKTFEEYQEDEIKDETKSSFNQISEKTTRHRKVSREIREILPTPSTDAEKNSLAECVKSWILRKVQSGNLTSFVYDEDYRVLVHRPKSGSPTQRSDVYLFVCLRCNTTIKALKRPNGQNWNAANVYRHISSVHFKKPGSQSSSRCITADITPPPSYSRFDYGN